MKKTGTCGCPFFFVLTRIILTVKTPSISSRRTLLLALLCALLAHAGLLLWRGWTGRSVVPVQRLSVQLVNATAAPVAATAMTPAPNVVPDAPQKKQQSQPVSRTTPVVAPTLLATNGDASAHINSSAPVTVKNALDGEAKAVGGQTSAPQGGTTEPARILFAPKPPLPDSARQRGETGTVVLRIQITEQGVATVSVQQSSGSARLDEAARSTAQQSWRFAPARQDGRKVEGEIIQPVEFRLTD